MCADALCLRGWWIVQAIRGSERAIMDQCHSWREVLKNFQDHQSIQIFPENKANSSWTISFQGICPYEFPWKFTWINGS